MWVLSRQITAKAMRKKLSFVIYVLVCWRPLGHETQQFAENDSFPFLWMIHANAWNSNLGTCRPVWAVYWRFLLRLEAIPLLLCWDIYGTYWNVAAIMRMCARECAITIGYTCGVTFNSQCTKRTFVGGSPRGPTEQRRRQWGEGGLPPWIKSGPLARGLARHNKRFTIEEIIKIVATRCQILRLKCTKSFFGWGSAPDPAGGAYSAPPDPLAGF